MPGPDEGRPPLPEPVAGDAAAIATACAPRHPATVRLLALAQEAREVAAPASLGALGRELWAWHRSQRGCTPASVAVAPPGPRSVVLVGGLGSTSAHAGIDGVDLVGLGYSPDEVVRFSYRGGRVPGLGRPSAPGIHGPLEALPASEYTAADTEVDLHRSADELRRLLDEVARARPGVPIDLLAHSQGGVVVRLALADAAAQGRLPAELGVVVTVATPQQGAELATAVAGLGPTTRGGLLASRLAEGAGIDLDPAGASIAQQSQTSAVVAELARPVPDGVALRTIGAAGDLVVPGVRTTTPGASSALVARRGARTHDELPADPAVTREIALARAGLAPACVGLAAGVGRVLASHEVARAEAGAGLVVGARPW